MAENTKIEWADHTLNWWTGCEHISPACDHCYAETWAKRAGRNFAERKLTTDATRRKALKWEANAAAFEREHGRRQRVFVNSLADVFDNKVPQEWRDSLFDMIRATPSLDYLLLTKRIGNAKRMLPADWGSGYPNVWMGSTVVTQEEADRDIPKLLALPARVRFLSIEPMLGQISLDHEWLECERFEHSPDCNDDLCALAAGENDCAGKVVEYPRIDWVIAGGESSSKARPSHPEWFRALRDQCGAAGVAFFFKQWGSWWPISQMPDGVSDIYFDPKYGRPKRDNYDNRPEPHPAETTVLQLDGTQEFAFPPGAITCYRVGKMISGRLLDRCEHNEFPRTTR
ncbi:MAG TPA: phage Gp37/Gp68 family protein [Steroidobacter sp.]|uniref:phage Gp37/Gp68 family protein n=1 Tax=Steroidobacter sp. TaxID=1978227 RepID=UPI002EDB4E49